MATPALDENGLARLTLREIAREHGPAGLDSPHLLATVLPDLLPGAPRENRLIIAAAQLGVAALLDSRMSIGMPVTTAINDVAARLADETALDADASRWVVTEYAYVLGHGPDPRTAVDTPPAGRPGNAAVPPQPRPESDPTSASPVSPAGYPVSPGAGPVASPGAPPYVPPVAPTRTMPLDEPTRPGRRRGLIVAASIVLVLVVASAVAYGLTRDAKKKNPPGGGGSSGPCVVGTWTQSDAFIRVDDHGNLTDDDSGTKLTQTSGSETRVFNADGTGTINLPDLTLEGDTSDGHHVLFFYKETSDGAFKWVWDGSTVTYSEVDLPGEFRVDVDGSTVEDHTDVNPLYGPGDADLSCDGDNLVQKGTGYERDYDRG